MIGRDDLEREAFFLCKCFFSADPGPQLVDRYVAAHTVIPIARSENSIALMHTLLEKKLNAEAVEYVLRLKNPDNVLTWKVQILHYLCEAERKHWQDFYTQSDSVTRGIISLTWSFSRTIKLWLQGNFILRRHHLA
jgi:hypothetical protein